MRLLAIETTGKQGTLAFSDTERCLLSVSLSDRQRSTQSLVPAIRNALEQLDWDVTMLTHIAVAVGPGSFTGLRVGITTARMMTYAVGAKIISVNTLQAMAANLKWKDSSLQVIGTAMDAQRGDLSAQFFRSMSGAVPKPLTEIELISSKNWWQKVAEYDSIVVASPMLDKICDGKPDHVQMADRENWFPHAEGVAKVAGERIALGQSDDIWTIRPFYSRLSAAEEKKLNPHY